MSASLYSQYIQERENGKVLETDRGFVTYFIRGDECYIRDIFVSPEYRNDYLATTMADRVAEQAKQSGCKYLLGSVCTSTNNWNKSEKVLESYGFKYCKSDKTMKYYIKELN